MKLLYCPICNDIVKLRRLYKTGGEPRTCTCGDSWGYYKKDGWHAVIGGDAKALGISNPSLHHALNMSKLGGSDRECAITAWAFREDAPRIERVE
jgi:hypothetical protein